MIESEETVSAARLMEPVSPEALMPDIGLWPWWLAGGLLLALLVVIAFYLRHRSPRISDPASVRNIAYSEALSAFENTNATTPRDAAIHSSLILRRYLSTAAGDPALFETQEEFLSRHDSLQALLPDAREAAASGFKRLASLKYAPEIPDADALEIITESKSLLQSLHQRFAA